MRVIGPFEIGEVLARGGTSVVHAARWYDDPAQAIVAKVASPGAEMRLHHENTMLREIEHPHVVAPVGFVDDGTAAALVLPRATCSLRAHVGRLSAGEVVDVAAAIAEAVAALHRAGLAHADISPGNVLLRCDGSAMIADFGNATRCTEAAARADVAQLAATALDALVPGTDDDLRQLLACVASAPVSAIELAARLREVVPESRPPDPFASAPVLDEPPTMTTS
jgi:eukaryotic-like serine/threonine-protein kinase